MIIASSTRAPATVSLAGVSDVRPPRRGRPRTGTSIAFIALIGIEVKNSILLVDFTNELRAQGYPLEEAIRGAGEARFFPILLTSLTAIGGLAPLVIEHSNLYSPLALVLIGGLVSSTLLSRLVTLVMSKLLLPRDLGHLDEDEPRERHRMDTDTIADARGDRW